MMKQLILTMTLLLSSTAFAGNFSGSGNSKSILILPEIVLLQGMSEFESNPQLVRISQTSDDDQPYIEQTQWGDILRYPETGDSIEAWEIVEDFVEPDLQGSVFLNYSRFPFGELHYDGKPTYICYALVEGAIYFGASENQLRITNAILHLATERNLIADRHSVQCKRTDAFLDIFHRANSILDLTIVMRSVE